MVREPSPDANQTLEIAGKLGLVGRAEHPSRNFPIAYYGIEQLGVAERGKQRIGVGYSAHCVQIEMPARLDMMPVHQV
jgi:hypothetical protein